MISPPLKVKIMIKKSTKKTISDNRIRHATHIKLVSCDLLDYTILKYFMLNFVPFKWAVWIWSLEDIHICPLQIQHPGVAGFIRKTKASLGSAA